MAVNDIFHYQHIDELPGLTIGEASSAQFSFEPHFHLDYHIGLVTKGTLHQTWKGEKHHLTIGDICFIPPDVVHNSNEQGTERYHLTTFRISPNRLKNLFTDSQYNEIHNRLAPSVIKNLSLAKRLLLLSNTFKSNNHCLQQESLLMTSMAELLNIVDKKRLPEEGHELGKQNFTKIREYCEANLQKKITLDELAALSDLTRFQFIRRFQKQIGLAPHAWLMRLRLEKACSSLASSNTLIANIAIDNGFYDQSHFNRMFKIAYQIAPSQYRLHTT